MFKRVALSSATVLGIALAVQPTIALAQDRDGYHDRDRGYAYRDGGREWRDHDRHFRDGDDRRHEERREHEWRERAYRDRDWRGYGYGYYGRSGYVYAQPSYGYSFGYDSGCPR